MPYVQSWLDHYLTNNWGLVVSEIQESCQEYHGQSETACVVDPVNYFQFSRVVQLRLHILKIRVPAKRMPKSYRISLCKVQAAHERLWAVRRFLHDQEEAVPKELEQALACIHSYLLVKRLVRRDDHQVLVLATPFAGHADQVQSRSSTHKSHSI